MSGIKELLAQLEDVLQQKHPRGYSILQPSADEQALERLKNTIFNGEQLPHELVLIYQWHNGQNGYDSLNPNDNRTLLSIDEAIRTWQFMRDSNEDILQPWRESWVPITHNGAGDHLVLETAGPNKGKMINYWHDWEDRSIAHDSLYDWLTQVLEDTNNIELVAATVNQKKWWQLWK